MNITLEAYINARSIFLSKSRRIESISAKIKNLEDEIDELNDELRAEKKALAPFEDEYFKLREEYEEELKRASDEFASKGLSTRTINVLLRNDILSIADLGEKTEWEFRKIRGVGGKVLFEVTCAMILNGIKFKRNDQEVDEEDDQKDVEI